MSQLTLEEQFQDRKELLKHLTEDFKKIVLYNRLLNNFEPIDKPIAAEPINRVNLVMIKDIYHLPNEIFTSLIPFDGTEIIDKNPLIKELLFITELLFEEVKKIEFYKSIIKELYDIFFDNYRKICKEKITEETIYKTCILFYYIGLIDFKNIDITHHKEAKRIKEIFFNHYTILFKQLIVCLLNYQFSNCDLSNILIEDRTIKYKEIFFPFKIGVSNVMNELYKKTNSPLILLRDILDKNDIKIKIDTDRYRKFNVVYIENIRFLVNEVISSIQTQKKITFSKTPRIMSATSKPQRKTK